MKPTRAVSLPRSLNFGHLDKWFSVVAFGLLKPRSLVPGGPVSPPHFLPIIRISLSGVESGGLHGREKECFKVKISNTHSGHLPRDN